MRCRPLVLALVLHAPALVVGSVAGKAYLERHRQWVATVAESIAQLPAQASVAVLDVGANDGKWADRLVHNVWCGLQRSACAREHFGARMHPLKLYFFEPNPVFTAKLQAAADRVGGRLVAAAAWTEDTNLTFYVAGKFADESTVSSSVATRKSLTQRKRMVVPAINFPRFLQRTVAEAELTILKLDVEGAEYSILPRLLLDGTLCRVQHLLVEWHLGALPEAERLAALNLRNAFELLLERGCARPPHLMFDEVWGNGRGLGGPINVPGLMELALQFSPRNSSSHGARERTVVIGRDRVSAMGKRARAPPSSK